MTDLTDEQWRAKLTPDEYHVLRESGTEPAFVGEYTDLEDEGIYDCRGCGAELFRSTEKFHSGCGWPSFWKPAESENVRLLDDFSGGRKRVEVRLAPEGTPARNDGFDVTPAKLITGLITERGVCRASEAGLARLYDRSDPADRGSGRVARATRR